MNNLNAFKAIISFCIFSFSASKSGIRWIVFKIFDYCDRGNFFMKNVKLILRMWIKVYKNDASIGIKFCSF